MTSLLFKADKNGRTPLHLAAFSDVTDNRMLTALLLNSSVLTSFTVEQLVTAVFWQQLCLRFKKSP
jgi:ankyrin repeat protein